ncbi:small-subunit processome [Trametes coccinea BRFM310]|uniref:Small-subunit processome n=1 Tax=Trametes coccinea (strain BRFM310) TaxID=1353009 RepID=A0A1Y2IRE4_TRAC3|nr:small-subunit processome [Trametes coccinea BRFM310]
MSSLKNSLHRRTHKERSQLSHRTRLGFLEKHKDYVLRARDYHSKQDRINLLREKAAMRNKDEFYFSMTREKTQGGVHVKDRGNEALPTDIVKVLKTQDENYLRTMRALGLKKIDRLKNQLMQLADLLKPGSLEAEDDAEELDEQELEVLREAGVIPPESKKARRKSHSKKGKHVLFAESEEEARRCASSARTASKSQEDDRMDVSQEQSVDLGWKVPEQSKRKRRKSKASAEGEETEMDVASIETAEQAKEHRTRLLKELSARLVRDRQLRYAERELEMQKALMGKGASRKLRGVERVDAEEDEDDDDEDRPLKKVDEKTWKPRVYKWRVERKR